MSSLLNIKYKNKKKLNRQDLYSSLKPHENLRYIRWFRYISLTYLNTIWTDACWDAKQNYLSMNQSDSPFV